MCITVGVVAHMCDFSSAHASHFAAGNVAYPSWSTCQLSLLAQFLLSSAATNAPLHYYAPLLFVSFVLLLFICAVLFCVQCKHRCAAQRPHCADTHLLQRRRASAHPLPAQTLVHPPLPRYLLFSLFFSLYFSISLFIYFCYYFEFVWQWSVCVRDWERRAA